MGKKYLLVIVLCLLWLSVFTQTKIDIEQADADKYAFVNRVAADGLGNLYVAMAYSGNLRLGGASFKAEKSTSLLYIKDNNDDFVCGIELPIVIRDISACNEGVWVLGQYKNAFNLLGKQFETDYYASVLLLVSSDGRILHMTDIKTTDGNVYAGRVFSDKMGNPTVVLSFDNSLQIGNITHKKEGSKNAVVANFDNKGQYNWSVLFSGGDSFITGINPQAIVGDDDGNIYVSGEMSGRVKAGDKYLVTNVTTFGPGERLFDSELFLAKINAEGECIFLKSIATDNTECTDMKFVNNSLVISGFFSGKLSGEKLGVSKFGGKEYKTTLTPEGGTTEDGFIANYSTDGSLIWIAFLHGLSVDRVEALAVDDKGNIFAAGFGFFEFGFKAVIGQSELQHVAGKGLDRYSNPDAFILKLDQKGSLVWFKRGGGEKSDELKTICVLKNSVIAGGSFTAHINFDGQTQTMENASL
jgi:hypothetical protein